MIIQNPLVPPTPATTGTTAAPVANAPAVGDNEKTETERPVQANERSERTNTEDRPDQASEDRFLDRGGQLDITV